MNGKTTLKKMRRYTIIYIMLIPVVIYFIVFSYYPLALGIYNSFMESKLLGNAKFVGLNNYKEVLKDSLYSQAFINTIVVGVGTFIFQFGAALLISLCINELKNKYAKSAVQSAAYLPYMISWAIVGGMWIKLLSPTGLVNGIFSFFIGDSYNPLVFMAEIKYSRMIMILTGAWRGAGYYAVLLLAAIVSIDQSIYEAAAIDGASRLKQIIYITIPNLVPTMKVITVLGSMQLLRNFDQIFIMGNSTTFDKVRNLLMLVYEQGVINFKIGVATAGATLVLIATFIISFIVRKLTKYDENYE